MQRIWTALLIAALVAVTIVLYVRRQPPEWSTRSPAALAEFRQGLTADMKFYHADALAHYRRAAELDPNFAMAKLKLLALLDYSEKDEIERLAGELRETKTDRLTEREKFLITHRLARLDKQNARAQKLLTTYVSEHPQDPYALSILCGSLWESRNWPEAEKCYRQLLEIDPNWVTAQNILGYTALAQGRFDDAEELFRTYLFIAPDQANPHDSLGEMLALRGRYDEAEKQLLEAIRVKPEFCPAWMHLFSCDLDQNEFEQSKKRLAELTEAGACEPELVTLQSCRIAMREALHQEDFAGAWREANSDACLSHPLEVLVLRYRAALLSGDLVAAQGIAAEVESQLGRQAKGDPLWVALAAHTEGLRLMVAGEPQAAAAALRKADGNLVYWGDGHGTFKLFNQLDLVRALEAAGDAEGATAVVEQVRAVNPVLAKRVEERAGRRWLWP